MRKSSRPDHVNKKNDKKTKTKRKTDDVDFDVVNDVDVDDVNDVDDVDVDTHVDDVVVDDVRFFCCLVF